MWKATTVTSSYVLMKFIHHNCVFKNLGVGKTRAQEHYLQDNLLRQPASSSPSLSFSTGRDQMVVLDLEGSFRA